MVSNKLTNRRLTARKPPVCHSGPAVGSILFPPEAVQLERTPLEKKLPGITSPIVPRTGRCPPPPPPPPPRFCELDPSELELLNEENANITPHACAEDLPEGEDVAMEYVLTGGEWDGEGPIPNCGSAGGAEYRATVPPGSYTLTVTFTWSDSVQCVAVCNITVIPEE